MKKKMVPGEGVEPSLPCGNWILNPARLPIPPSGQVVFQNDRNLSFLQERSFLKFIPS
jgi:hypothetical protein